MSNQEFGHLIILAGVALCILSAIIIFTDKEDY